MSLMDRLTEDMKIAMKAGDKLRLSTLRMLISAVRYAEIDSRQDPTSSHQGGTTQGQVTDDKIIAVLQKEAKKRRESIEAYTAAGRTEAADQEKNELTIIEEYLPKMMSETEVRAKVAEVLKSGAFPNFGAAMGAAMGALKGQADGGLVARVVKELFSINNK